MKYPLRGYIFLVGTAFFTALSYVFGKAVNKDLNPETVIFFWFFGAFFFSIFAVMLIPSQRTELRYLRNYVTIFVLSSIVTAIGAALWIFSLRTIGPPLTSFLMKSQTLFSLLLGIMFLGERLNKGETIGIMLTIAGGVIVAYQEEGYLILGTFMALLSAFFYSLLSFLVKKFAQDLNMLTVANLRALGVAIVVFVYLIITERFQAPGLRDLVFMAFGGLTGAYIAKASQFQSIKLLDVSHSTAVMPLESLFVVLFSYFIFQDLPSVIKLIGGAGIIIGVVFLVIFRGEKADLEVSED
ncbi:MAG: DMT superfamily permease [Candidatus Dadabacteria bacterium CSP1-2]|nr:MAG: DMT superfamily permease [Candidatus Dadabacteria bacterium CSP1-2]